ncbi:chaperonin 10-like protein [Pterulicium gracile]|uniref:Chaperonin 10-like protein n=1 Tax=Pterulicium gracile TaxID=1884261 RepID=A0A5C3QSX3_9AGAR|nr:chaperonin 10-like protein [Pterula gracilis]
MMNFPKSVSLSLTYRALVTQSGGGFKVAEVYLDANEVKPHEVLVKVRAVGLNPTDWKSFDWLKIEDAVVGCDAAGDIVCVGSEVTRFKAGDRVAGFTIGCSQTHNGAFAEYVRFDAFTLLRLPEGMPYEEGASLPIPHLTAVQNLHVHLNLPTPSQAEAKLSPSAAAGTPETILIWGGTTATGHHAIQLARLSGLRVIATASPQAFDEVLALGASFVFDYRDVDVVEKIREAAGDSEMGVRYVLDTISKGGATEKCIDAMGPKGGQVVHLLPVSKDIVKRRADVEVSLTLVYNLLGPMLSDPFRPQDRPPVQRYLENDWIQLSKGWSNGVGTERLKPQRIRRLERGFDGIVDGLKQMREGRYGREKLVGYVC